GRSILWLFRRGTVLLIGGVPGLGAAGFVGALLCSTSLCHHDWLLITPRLASPARLERRVVEGQESPGNDEERRHRDADNLLEARMSTQIFRNLDRPALNGGGRLRSCLLAGGNRLGLSENVSYSPFREAIAGAAIKPVAGRQ